MASGKKIRVMALYGGRSGEHEVSLRSAASVIRHLNREKYEVIPVAIDKKGRWLLQDIRFLEKSGASLPVQEDLGEVFLPPHPKDQGTQLIQMHAPNSAHPIDVVFPVMHGPLCEDGTIQGFLELAEIPYVGCGVLASAVGMDKDIAKRLIRDAGLPIVPYVCVRSELWKRDPKAIESQVAQKLSYPVFVKPANLGSSVGVHKVRSSKDLAPALDDAFRYDRKVLVERAVNAREIEFAVLENPEPGAPPLVSAPGEIAPTHEFYSYEAKYLDEGGARLMIPAKIDPRKVVEGQRIAREAFEVLEGEGMGRVDLFLDQDSDEFYFNEVNTLPGFTSISMYPKMWEYSGIHYTDLLSRLIDLALSRHQQKKNLIRDVQAP